MCIIAGYVGTKPAAPILIEMLRKEEAMDSGFYTGIATIHEGKIHYRKKVGSLDRLLAETDAADLPGTIGILHGRTPGGKGTDVDSWSHPFTCEKDGEVKTAFVLNGFQGFFKDWNTENIIPVAQSLIDAGYEMKTAVPADGFTPCLANGTRVHGSDVRTQYASKLILEGMDTVSAVGKTFCDVPVEAVGLMLAQAEPDAITWVRYNFPMHLSFADHGAYLATVPLAFPEDAGDTILLPAASSGLIKKDHYTCYPFQQPHATVAPITPELWKVAYEKIIEHIRQGETVFRPIVDPLFHGGDVTQMGAVLYQVLSHLYKEGRIKIEIDYVPGHGEGIMAPKARYILVD